MGAVSNVSKRSMEIMMLVVPKINPNVDVTLNIGLGSSIAWGKYKAVNLEHGAVQSLTDILDAPYRIARIVEAVKHLAYNPVLANCQPYGIDYGTEPHIQYKIVQSDTEATLVVKFNAVARDIIGQVFTLAEHFKQDCIAVWIHNDAANGGIGQLIGRYNYVWGSFNPEYFIHLEN